jgi:AtzE family amidohydrolase
VTAEEIASAVRSRTTSAHSIVTDALTRIAATSELNAFTDVFAERALTRARAIDAAVAAGEDPGPLTGVPFAAKNLFDVAGVVTRAGARVTLHDPPADRDADAISALERSGAVLIGVTNMDEFAYGFVTENAHYGTTRNPHDRTRIAGGSSGGSAAAVAADLVPLALGTDTNGSIRIPAAFCGIFSIRPTFATCSRRGAYPFVNSLDTVGIFSRTAGDLSAAFAAQAPQFGPNAGSPSELRCARLGGYFDRGLRPEARSAVDAVGLALETTTVVELPHASQAREAAFVITAAEGGELHADRLKRQANEYDPATRERLIAGALMPADWYVRAQRFRTLFRSELEEMFAAYDVLIAPATPFPATTAGQPSIVVDGVETDIRSNIGAFTQPITLCGAPVVTVPVLVDGALPLGVQLIGRPGSDNVLLTLAKDLEGRGIVGARAVQSTAP